MEDNDNLRCYNKAETESEEDKYDGTTDDEQDSVAWTFNPLPFLTLPFLPIYL